jgi:hypothetical protein
MHILSKGFRGFFRDIFKESDSPSTLKRVRSFKLFAILILAFLDIFLIYFIFSKPVSQAYYPQDVFISNLTPNSAAISWNTKTPIESIILLTDSESFPPLPFLSKERFYDDKDKFFKEPNKYRLHHVTVGNLLPGKTYKFGIYAGLKRVRQVKFTTPKNSLDATTPSIITGKVLHTDGQTQAAGLNVYYIVSSGDNRSTLLSTVSDPEGIWLFDASKLYKEDLISPLKANDNMNHIITIDASPLGKYEISTTSASLKQWPTVTLKDKR